MNKEQIFCIDLNTNRGLKLPQLRDVPDLVNYYKMLFVIC